MERAARPEATPAVRASDNQPATGRTHSGTGQQVAEHVKRDWCSEEFRQLVTLGESTTAGGWSSNRERCWAAQLARLINDFQRIPLQLVNVGIGANLISQRSPAYEHSGKPAALMRLEPHVFKHNPDLLIVAYGLNDSRGGTPLELFREEMKSLLDQVRQKIQPLIVLPGPYYMVGFERYGPHFNHATLEIFHQFNDAIRSIAAEKDCLFVDLLSAYGNANWLIHNDGCHANDVGHRIVANKIFEVLATNCSGLSKETQELEKHIPPWRDESVLRHEAGEK
ncbi:MAG: SGNH/GDSL hydrolase family protein [Planctomycetales bacterium]|jgi:lysophospholipase L1-like esterase|nr:SGNH/GDSL hydrolase family protein [Planctomycetales bacterium]